MRHCLHRHDSAFWNRTKTLRHVGSYLTSYSTKQISCTNMSKYPQTLVKVSLQSENGLRRKNGHRTMSAEGIVFRDRILRHGVWKKEQIYYAIYRCVITVVTTSRASGQKKGGSWFDSRWDPWKFPRDIFLLSSHSSPGANSAPSRNECKEISMGVKCRRR